MRPKLLRGSVWFPSFSLRPITFFRLFFCFVFKYFGSVCCKWNYICDQREACVPTQHHVGMTRIQHTVSSGLVLPSLTEERNNYLNSIWNSSPNPHTFLSLSPSLPKGVQPRGNVAIRVRRPPQSFFTRNEPLPAPRLHFCLFCVFKKHAVSPSEVPTMHHKYPLPLIWILLWDSDGTASKLFERG